MVEPYFQQPIIRK